MPSITVTLVDHINSATNLRLLIVRHLEEIFSDLLDSDELGVVNVRWMTSSPAAGDQDLVLHFVNDIASSYIAQKMPGDPINPVDGGFTRSRGDITGSEFYRFPRGFPKGATATGYAKLAAHEAMHNVTGLGNAQLHGLGGIANSPPQLPVTPDNRTMFQNSLSKIPDQLL
jgi:hypothetical protein